MADLIACTHETVINCPDCGKPMCAVCKAACTCEHANEHADERVIVD